MCALFYWFSGLTYMYIIYLNVRKVEIIRLPVFLFLLMVISIVTCVLRYLEPTDVTSAVQMIITLAKLQMRFL